MSSFQEQFLLRQIHPDLVTDGRIQSTAFNPTRSHNFKLSTNDSRMISAKDAFSRHIDTGLSTTGVLGITERDCTNNDLDIDPDGVKEDGLPDDHISIVFPEPVGNAGKRRNKKSAESLRDEAFERGWFYRPKEFT